MAESVFLPNTLHTELYNVHYTLLDCDSTHFEYVFFSRCPLLAAFRQPVTPSHVPPSYAVCHFTRQECFYAWSHAPNNSSRCASIFFTSEPERRKLSVLLSPLLHVSDLLISTMCIAVSRLVFVCVRLPDARRAANVYRLRAQLLQMPRAGLHTSLPTKGNKKNNTQSNKSSERQRRH